MRLLVLILFFVGIGCRNPYVDFYKDTTGGKNLRDSTIFVQSNGVDLRNGNNPKEDEINMMENGFIMVGYSSFNAGDIRNPENYAIEHAGKIGASVCVVYQPKHTGSMQGNNTVFIPGRYAGFAINTPTQINRYDYLVTYWMKENVKYILGAMLSDLSPDDKAKQKTNKGVKVLAVIKGTPAFKADLLRGDIIKKVDDIDVDDRGHIGKIFAENKGKTVAITVVRADSISVVPVSLN